MDQQLEPTHEILMGRFKAGLDQSAFEQLVRDYTRGAVAVARQMLRDRALSEDAVQEAFVRVIAKRDQYVTSSPFSRWFYAILRNVCIDMLRKKQRAQALARQMMSRGACGIGGRGQSDATGLLDLLACHERNVLELRVVHSMSFKEVAAALGISEEAAKKRAQRGLQKLRQKLTHEHARRQAV